MKFYHDSVLLRNTATDPDTGKKDLNAAINISVKVEKIDGSDADIFDINENQTSNPLLTDSNGNYVFGVEDGIYNIYENYGSSNQTEKLKVEIKESRGVTTVKEQVFPVEGQLIYTLAFSSGTQSVLVVDGRVMSTGSEIIGNTLTIEETLYPEQSVYVYHNGLVTANSDREKGTKGNPYIFDTTDLLIASGAELQIGDWAETLGNEKKYDGKNAIYRIVGFDDVGEQDGYSILNIGSKKAFLMYTGGLHTAEQEPNSGVETVNNFPYQFSYPASELERQDMLRNLTPDSNMARGIGYGGSTWWTRPVAVGRKEDGIDVVYRGDTYGSPENRDLAQGSMDDSLWTNKRLGEAVIKLTRLTFDGTDYEYSFNALNDKNVSYREDEHMQPSVNFNNVNGQVITGWGSRNQARDQDGNNISNINYIKYGQDSRVLSASETVEFDTTADYASQFFVGRTNYVFSREGVGDWHFTRGSGGQNYLDPIQFFDAEGAEIENQFYFGISGVDKSQVLSDPQSTTDRNIVHFFGAPHPTANPDNKLYYCKGTFVLADQEPSPFDGGGLYVTKVDGTTPVSGSNGRLDTGFTAFQKAAMDEAYNPGAGRSYRLLDVYYGDDPIALIGEFAYDWTHGDSVPYEKTWDLKTVRWNGSSWVVNTIASGLRGALGYDPTQNNAGNGEVGVEGYTSFYMLGASFWRGKDYTDTQPIIYYCDRDGNRRDGYRLNKVTCTDLTFSSVSTNTSLISNSSKILYRPEMTLYGDKRLLWFNSADGWSSFNSFVADTKFIDETV